MPNIKLRSIEFSEIPFRKLKSIIIPIADRITVIAGHNGIGKSTILAFVANGSGLSEKLHTSYFNKAVQANMQDILHLSPEHDIVESVEEKPYVLITYDIEGQSLVKKCNVTRRGQRLLRVVPRNEPKREFSYAGITFSSDAKVPLPTIYLGMSRMIPVGESVPADVHRSSDTTMTPADRLYIHNLTNDLIDTGSTKSDLITHQSIAHTRKVSKHAHYDYDSRAVSLGQDSLSSIVTALVSFKKLQREMEGNYPGGLLIIDEIDAGFHPKTQRELVRVLQKEAKALKLQIIATTHSLPLIEKIHADQSHLRKSALPLDVVHYLQDTRQPHLCEGWTFDDIRADMYLDAKPPSPPKNAVVMLYSEDDEAHYITERIVRGAIKSKITRETGARIKPLSIKMGCDDLMKLYKADSYFKTVVIVLDADANLGKLDRQRNVVRLPGVAPRGQRPTPELLLYRFFESLYRNPERHTASWNKLKKKKYSADYIRDNLLDSTIQIDKRDSAKAWFKKSFEHMDEWGLVDLWIEENSELREVFVSELINAIKSVLPRP